jgi:glycosyltransferase involved in cell wall biosynthesis
LSSRRAVWRRGIEYRPSVGGVVPMMRALIRAAQGRWMAPNPYWVSAGLPSWPLEAQTDEGFRAVFAKLPADLRAGYTSFKSAIWDALHGVRGFEFSVDDYRAFLAFGQIMASRLLDVHREVDVYYVNDFQQVQVGPLVGPAAPTILRWHIPFRLHDLPRHVRQFFLKSIEGFDAVVVSTRRDLEALVRHGYSGRACQVYPYLNPEEVRRPSQSSTEAFRERWKLGDGPVVLCVARMDQQKRHDLLLEGFARVARRHPDARLVLVGNGSFSSSRASGLGSDAPGDWRATLASRARGLKIESAVRFTGYLENEELRAAYGAATVLVLPSPIEGFGLVGVEAWLHERPIIVSDGAGISEIVNHGINGFVARAYSVSDLATHLGTVLRSPEGAEKMGKEGSLAARACFAPRATARLEQLFHEVLAGYPARPQAPTKRTSRRRLSLPGQAAS